MHNGGDGFELGAEKTLPLGLAGVLSRMARVCGVMAARRASMSSAKSGSASGTRPA